jgi:hypothetical protein
MTDPRSMQGEGPRPYGDPATRPDNRVALGILAGTNTGSYQGVDGHFLRDATRHAAQ